MVNILGRSSVTWFVWGDEMQDADGRSALSSRRLRSCGLGCLVSLVLLIALAVGLYYWAVTPGPQVPGDAFVGRETVGVVYVSGLHDDPAFVATVQNALRVLQDFNYRQAQASNLPFFLRRLAGRRKNVGEGDVQKAIRDVPRDLAVLCEQLPGSSNPNLVVIANLNRFPRALHLVYSVTALLQGSESYHGYRILRLGQENSPSVAFIEDTLIWAQNSDAVRQVLARYLSPESPAVTPMTGTLRVQGERWNLFGIADNRDDLLGWLADRSPKSWKQDFHPEDLKPVLRTIESLEFGLDITDEGALEGFVDARLDSAEHATELKELVTGLITRKDEPIPFRIEKCDRPQDFRGTFHLGDLEGRLERELEKARERKQ